MTSTYFDPINGILTLNTTQQDPLYYSRVIEMPCFETTPANACVTFVGNNAIMVDSKYNNNIANLSIPYVYGVALTAANGGQSATFANIPGCIYTSTVLIPGNYNDTLYVGQNGLLTNVMPSILNGDLWGIVVGIKISDYNFIYNPEPPIDIVHNTFPAQVPQVIGSNETIVLANAMPKLTCFGIDNTGKAYTITAIDAIIPLVDGITLESGGINQQISVARLKNYYYETGTYFTDGSMYYLSDTGIITNVRPTSSNYLVIIGRGIPNSTKFIFDPQLPIRLSN